MRNLFVLAAAVAALSLAACCSDDSRLGAAPGASNCGGLVYSAPHCLPKINLPGVPYPGSPDCNPTEPAAPAAAAPALEDGPHCGPLPTNAKVGEVWCCEFIQPPAAAPVDVEVEPARTEWQRVACEDGSNDCWALVTVPPKIEHRVSAPPPGYYEWRRNERCEVQRVKP